MLLEEALADIFAVIFHPLGKDQENVEPKKGPSIDTQLTIMNSLQHSPKFNSIFDQPGYGPQARLAAIEAIMRISADLEPQCYVLKPKCIKCIVFDEGSVHRL